MQVLTTLQPDAMASHRAFSTFLAFTYLQSPCLCHCVPNTKPFRLSLLQDRFPAQVWQSVFPTSWGASVPCHGAPHSSVSSDSFLTWWSRGSIPREQGRAAQCHFHLILLLRETDSVGSHSKSKETDSTLRQRTWGHISTAHLSLDTLILTSPLG